MNIYVCERASVRAFTCVLMHTCVIYVYVCHINLIIKIRRKAYNKNKKRILLLSFKEAFNRC